VAFVDVAQSVVVARLLVMHANAGVDGKPNSDANADADVDEVDECGGEHTPLGILGQHYWMVLP
jgi:hypothetical protein